MRIRVIPSQQIVKNMCDCVCVTVCVQVLPTFPYLLQQLLNMQSQCLLTFIQNCKYIV